MVGEPSPQTGTPLERQPIFRSSRCHHEDQEDAIRHYSKSLMFFQYFQDNRKIGCVLEQIELTIMHFLFEFSHIYMVCKKITYIENQGNLQNRNR